VYGLAALPIGCLSPVNSFEAQVQGWSSPKQTWHRV